MSTTIDPNAALLAQANPASTAKTEAQKQTDRFLTLLVTQMKNQDPLNPLSNAEVTSQMAQLSTVTGIEQLNATLNAMNQTQSYQAASLIGHGVLAPGSFINLTTDSNGKSYGVAGVTLPSAADTVKVSIKDANGNLVKTINLGKQDQGSPTFSWDGTTDAGAAAPAGAYTFSVEAAQAGKPVTVTDLAVGGVNSVVLGSNGVPQLDVQGMGLISMSDVKQIL